MRSYKIFQIGEGPGQVNVGVEFLVDGVTVDRHNLTFPADRTPEEIRTEIENQLNAKADGINVSRALATMMAAEVNVERQVIPTALSFTPPAGSIAFPATVTVTPSEPLPATMEIRYTLDGSDPGELSAPYRTPVSLAGSGSIKAAVFDLITNVRGRVFTASYSAQQAPGPQPVGKAALMAAIPQADLSKALANDMAYRVVNSFLINGPDPVATTQEAAGRVKAFVDQFLAGTILSQAGYDAVKALVTGNGWTWA